MIKPVEIITYELTHTLQWRIPFEEVFLGVLFLPTFMIILHWIAQNSDVIESYTTLR